LDKILQTQKRLSTMVFHIIHKGKFGAIKDKIQSGDIIVFATNQESLDVTHVVCSEGRRKSAPSAGIKQGRRSGYN
jgi:hypothetical protein